MILFLSEGRKANAVQGNGETRKSTAQAFCIVPLVTSITCLYLHRVFAFGLCKCCNVDECVFFIVFCVFECVFFLCSALSSQAHCSLSHPKNTSALVMVLYWTAVYGELFLLFKHIKGRCYGFCSFLIFYCMCLCGAGHCGRSWTCKLLQIVFVFVFW